MSLVVPLVALAALWGFALDQSAASALDLRRAHASRDHVGRPVDRLVEALQYERSRTQQYLATNRRDDPTLIALRAATDKSIAEFRRLSQAYEPGGAAGQTTQARVEDLLANIDGLARVRAQADSGSISRSAALFGYSSLISYAFSVRSAAAEFSDPDVEREMRTVVAISHVAELFCQEDALMTGAATAGRFGSGDYTQLVKIVGALRYEITNAGSGLPEQTQAAYFNMLGNPAFTALRTTEDRIINDGRPRGPATITLVVWRATADPAIRQMDDFLSAAFDKVAADARAAGTAILTRLYLAGGAGLFVVLLSVLLSVRTGRSVVRRLTALRAAATELAGKRLPEVVARLRAGEIVSAHCDPLVVPSGHDEIADVGAALRDVQCSAVESAIAEADLRRGMSRMFVNISRRNQSLINRQLALLNQLAAGADTPEDQRTVMLAEQLATRMRRHAEDLVIIAGSAPSRSWLRPVPLSDVIRGAVTEIEAGERVEVGTVTDVHLPGSAVADVIHLLAELLENATAYSPPHTPVQVCAQQVPYGVGVEIEDRGLGMTATALEEANGKLAQPPDFDPANSSRLGLFVVAQLAAMRDLRVSLRQSSYGGVTAVVLIPSALLAKAAGAGPKPAGHPLVGARLAASADPESPDTWDLPSPPSAAPSAGGTTAVPWSARRAAPPPPPG